MCNAYIGSIRQRADPGSAVANMLERGRRATTRECHREGEGYLDTVCNAVLETLCLCVCLRGCVAVLPFVLPCLVVGCVRV